MAEKYGVIPKRFTKAWWEYFWMYYKWHTIVTVFVILAVGITIHQKVTAPKYDLTLTYAGASVFSNEQSANIEKGIAKLTPDVNKNGEKLLSFISLNLSESETDPQYIMAMQTKLQLALSEDETYIYIMDKEIIDAYAGDSDENCAFAPVEDWLTADIDRELLYAPNEKPIAVKLNGNSNFAKLGVDMADKYLAIRYYPRKDQIKKQLEGYKGAVVLANNIIES